MSTVPVELTLDQIIAAVKQLPLKEKVRLKKQLEADLDQRLGKLLTELWDENREYSEEEVAADVARAIEEVRAER